MILDNISFLAYYVDMNEDKLLTYEEVSGILKVSVYTVRRYTKQKPSPLPVVRLNDKTVRIRKSELDKWLLDLNKASN